MSGDRANELRDEALRKIGRNLVNFQRFERALKLVVVGSNIRGYASQLAKAHREKAKDTDRKPMGWLVEELFKTAYASDMPDQSAPTELNEVWMSFSFRFELDEDAIRARKRELSDLVRQRNSLIHRSLASFNPDSPESCRQLILVLDEQNDSLEPHYNSLISIIGDIREAQKDVLKRLEDQLREQAEDGGNAA